MNSGIEERKDAIESGVYQSHVNTRANLIEEIEYVSPAFTKVTDAINSWAWLSISHTFIAWRTGISDRFIKEVLLSRIQMTDVNYIIIPSARVFWSNIKNINTIDQQQITSSLEKNKIYISNSSSQKESLKIIERLLNICSNETMRKTIILMEIIGAFDSYHNRAIHLLLKDGLSKGIIFWLHAKISNIPNGILDQFHNHFVLMPSFYELNDLSKIQPISYDQLEEKGNRRHIAVVQGYCLPISKSWDIINLSGDSEHEISEEIKRLGMLLYKKKHMLLDVENNLTDKYIDPRSRTLDQEKTIKNLEQEIKSIENSISKLTL
jgi:hypothetical protein